MRSRVSFIVFLAYALRRLRRDCSGASAIEFALMAPLMLIGVFAILEIALMFVAAQVLATGTETSTRLIMTGQVKSSGATSVSKDAFKAMVCERVKVLLNCQNLYVDAQAYSKAPIPEFPYPVEDKKFVDNTKFITGQQGDIVVVRTFYEWPVFLTGFFYGYDQSNLDGGKRLLSASAAVRNEPW
jgi:Flp pilus assembly protein TadG